MIDIKQDHKGDGFILTQTINIEGDDYHKCITLSPSELDSLYSWLRFHCPLLVVGKNLEYSMNILYKAKKNNFGHKQYACFNGIEIDSDMSIDDAYQKVFKSYKADFDKKVEEERKRYADRH